MKFHCLWLLMAACSVSLGTDRVASMSQARRSSSSAVGQAVNARRGDKLGDRFARLAQASPQEVAPSLRAAVRANPKDPETLLTLTATQLELLQIEESRETVRQIESLPALDPWFLYRLGNLLLENNLTTEAQTAYERAIATLEIAKGSEPPDAKRLDLYFQAARLRFNHHDYQKTLHYLEPVQVGNADAKLQAAVLDMKGASLLGIGNIEEAVQDLAGAVRMDASKLEYLLHLTWAERMAGDSNAALDTLKKAEDRWTEAREVSECGLFWSGKIFPHVLEYDSWKRGTCKVRG